MKALRKFVTLLAISGIAVSCGDDADPFGNGNGLTVADIAGNYTATKFEFTMVDPPNASLDLIALTGELTVNIATDGSFTASLLNPLAPPAVPFTGNITISGTTLTLTVSDTVIAGSIELLPEEPFVFDNFTLSGDELTLSASSGVDFDFGGGEVAATLLLVATRS